MHRLTRVSSLIGFLAGLCAAPTVLKMIDHYRAEGMFDYTSIGDLIIVPVYYLVARWAERQMRETVTPTSDSALVSESDRIPKADAR